MRVMIELVVGILMPSLSTFRTFSWTFMGWSSVIMLISALGEKGLFKMSEERFMTFL